MEFQFSAPTSEIISNLTKNTYFKYEIVHPIILVSSNIIIISVVLAYLLYTGIEAFIILILLALIFYFWVTSKSKIYETRNNFSKFRPFGQDYFRNNIL